MNRYYFDEADDFTGDQNYDSDFLPFGRGQIDQPRWSPIRKKDKLRLNEGSKTKAKRSDKKIQNKIKYDWQGG